MEHRVAVITAKARLVGCDIRVLDVLPRRCEAPRFAIAQPLCDVCTWSVRCVAADVIAEAGGVDQIDCARVWFDHRTRRVHMEFFFV